MNPFSHKCRYSCNDNFTENDRQEIIDNFWQESNFDRQNLFLLSCVQIVVLKRPKADAVKPKSASRACYLKGKRVCREFLLRTLDTSHGRFYSRQLWVYNLGIHTNIGRIMMNVWDETVASRGSREVGSCLLDFATDLPLGVTKLIAWSDSCGGQNKHYNIPRYWMTILQNTHITQVDHKFLELGHTYLENDEDFGIIERQKRRQQLIYTPDDWRQLIRSSSRHFLVTDMTQDKFVNTDTLDCMLYVPKKNGKGIPIKWREIRWMRFESSAPTCMQYKTTLQDEVAFSSVHFRRATRGRQAANLLPPLQPLYREPRNISKLKWKDLQSLKMFIPPVTLHMKRMMQRRSTPIS